MPHFLSRLCWPFAKSSFCWACACKTRIGYRNVGHRLGMWVTGYELSTRRVDLNARIEHEEQKLSEVQDPAYSDDQRDMIEGRIKRLRDELNERNEEIDILKGEASKQINQIRGSITKFLDKETGTLGERIRTLFKEQGITIVSILTAVGMVIGVLVEALLGGPSMSTTTSTSDEAVPATVTLEKVGELENG